MTNLNSEVIVAVVRNKGEISWYRSNRELWVLDLNKWREDFTKKGYIASNTTIDFRNGISIVDKNTKDIFLQYMSQYKINPDQLSIELANRYQSADSWWDVGDLFPIIFVDFDKEQVGTFYPGGIALERYTPDSWRSEFIDFANEYPDAIFPEKDKFWIKNGCNLLKLLNERALKSRS